jgi:hypothetical protein
VDGQTFIAFMLLDNAFTLFSFFSIVALIRIDTSLANENQATLVGFLSPQNSKQFQKLLF